MSFFAENKKIPQEEISKGNVKPWTVLIVDDDPEIHQMTQLALKRFEFKGRPLSLLSAYSGEEACSIFENQDNIALALIDVVMESDHAGLDLVKYIRSSLKNRNTRLVLRTGQAGHAPEDYVIQEYEIDDYKEKTELTTQKLRTLLYSMLRSYNDLCIIDEQKRGLSKVIQASANVQNTQTLKTYATTVLKQLTTLLEIDASAFYCLIPHDIDGSDTRLLTLAATGDYVSVQPFFSFDALPESIAERCKDIIKNGESQYYSDAHVFYSVSENKLSSLLYLDLSVNLSPQDRQLLDIYVQNIALTFENLNLMIDIQETSKEVVFNLANAVEVRSKETGAHVQRVAMMSERLATYYGLSEQEVTLIKMAAPLHDIGKVAIPDHILHKPAKLDADEWLEMKKHVEYGTQILSTSKRPLIKKACEIVSSHHEKWDGSGYPNGLSGENIPVSGRILALADVFDALGSKRCYKDAWDDEAIKKEFIDQRGKHFEPALVDIMLEHWDEFIKIRQLLPDEG